ncbi:hypothetical protein [Mangrovibacterium marinum]|uniref:Uncharacterized protein n=1 Tax=Mangrovibacterium marinum TaxID=1639118 RepID=A0A2T5C298_9BACT|nr:hypothetical protein [Mangrovibacterium marinum]PTN08822.1 hypothetical protein C8N47_107183 [Mangrovibacterium marinum]
MRKSKERKFITIFGSVILLLVAVQYVVLSIIAVRNYVKMLYQQEDVRLLSVAAEPDAETCTLYRDKTWLESRFQLTKADSISLSVNLKDSVLQLELKGVVLKSSKLIDFQIDELFRRLNIGAYHHYFGEPARGTSLLSTIARSPLVVKKAPRDSVEYANQQHIIATTRQEIVHWMLTLDNQIVLKIEGVDTDARSEWLQSKQFWWKQDLKQAKTDLQKTIRFKQPDYRPSISLILNEADAKAIFRALPDQPQVCVRL